MVVFLTALVNYLFLSNLFLLCRHATRKEQIDAAVSAEIKREIAATVSAEMKTEVNLHAHHVTISVLVTSRLSFFCNLIVHVDKECICL